MINRRMIFSVLAVIAVVTGASAVAAGNYHFTPIAFPGSNYTTISAINAAGNVAGNYLDANNYTHGFLWAHGAYLSIDYPGANETIVNGINAAGEIVGQYSDANWIYHGFIWAHGDFIGIDYPGAAQTIALGINASGKIVGKYYNADNWKESHGFLLSRGSSLRRWSFAPIDFPGSVNTNADFINNSGQIIGMYGPITHFIHWQDSFLLKNNNYIPIAVPGAREKRTFAYGINNSGQIVGAYQDAATGRNYGFLRRPGGAYQTLDYPGATITAALDINNSGDIVGYYFDADNLQHGFVRSGKTYTSIDYPGFANTEVHQINEAGQIIGSYADANNNAFSFIADPHRRYGWRK